MRNIHENIYTIIRGFRAELSNLQCEYGGAPHLKPSIANRYLPKIEQYLKSTSHKPLDLSNLYLCNIDLQGVDVSGCDFKDSHLGSAKFAGATIKDSDFSRCVITHANFSNVIGNGNTNFTYANLSGCQIDFSVISNTKFGVRYDVQDGMVRPINELRCK